MNKKISTLFVLVFSIFYSLPTYATGYEDTSLFKIIFQLIFYIIIFILVIFLSLYGTKLIAKNFRGITSSKYISLLDVMNIPGGAKIVIAKINGKFYILSTTNNGTNVIDIIEEDQFCVEEENFDNYLSKYLNRSHDNYKMNKKIENLISKINIKRDKEDKKNEEKY